MILSRRSVNSMKIAQTNLEELIVMKKKEEKFLIQITANYNFI